MDERLYKIAALHCSNSYEKRHDLGTTEFAITYAVLGDEIIQVLSIPGSDEFWDWIKNCDLRSVNGIKKAGYDAAIEIVNSKQYEKEIDENLRLLVTGHSKGGPTAIAYKKIFGAEWCVAFAPARSLRYNTNREMDNTTIFVDPDDPVSEALGIISFGHPICTKIKAKDDHFLWSIGDHPIHNWVTYTQKYK